MRSIIQELKSIILEKVWIVSTDGNHIYNNYFIINITTKNFKQTFQSSLASCAQVVADFKQTSQSSLKTSFLCTSGRRLQTDVSEQSSFLCTSGRRLQTDFSEQYQNKLLVHKWSPTSNRHLRAV